MGNSKIENRFNNQNNNFARASRFFDISLPSLHDYDLKMPLFTFYSGSTQLSDDEISSLFLNLDMVLRNSTFIRVHLHLTKLATCSNL